MMSRDISTYGDSAEHDILVGLFVLCNDNCFVLQLIIFKWLQNSVQYTAQKSGLAEKVSPIILYIYIYMYLHKRDSV